MPDSPRVNPVDDRAGALSLQLLAAGIPIDGVSIITFDPLEAYVRYLKDATPEQQKAGDALLAAFDFSQDAMVQRAAEAEVAAVKEHPVYLAMQKMLVQQANDIREKVDLAPIDVADTEAALDASDAAARAPAETGT